MNDNILIDKIVLWKTREKINKIFVQNVLT